MEFEEQPIIYKCVEAIYQPPKSKDMEKTWSRLQRSNAAMVTWSSRKIRRVSTPLPVQVWPAAPFFLKGLFYERKI